MRNTSTRFKRAAITAATLAISLLIGTGISDARKSNSAINKAGAKRAPAVSVKSSLGKSGHMSHGAKKDSKPSASRGKLSGGKSNHKLQGRILSVASASRNNSFAAPTHSRATRESALPGTTPSGISPGKLHFPGRTVRPPFERIPDPSDGMRGWEERDHVPGRDMINSKYLGGPDRAPGNHGLGRDYYTQNALYDISSADCLWDEATWNKVSHWGPQAGPLAGDTTTGNWRCDPAYQDYDNNKGGGGKTSGGKQTSDKTTGTRETVKEPKPLKETTSKPDGSRGKEEGDDPDEFRSPIARETVKRLLDIDMISRNDSRNRGSGNSTGPGLTRSGTNTPRGLPHARELTLGPYHPNRPDTTGSPVSSGLMANVAGYAASPTPDGGSNPPPGPEYSPVTSGQSAVAGSTMANQMGYALSPAVGTDGKDPGPRPGPEF